MAFGGIIGRQTTTYTNEEIDGMIQGLQQQITGGLKIETGSYVGNGKSGPDSISISFVNQPWIVWIYSLTQNNGLDYSMLFNCQVLTGTYQNYAFITFSKDNISSIFEKSYTKIVGNTIYWYGDDYTQNKWCNSINQTYKYFAICSS